MAAKNRHNAIDCMSAALFDEEYFVLLARDPLMPALLGIWASLRVGNFAAAAENFQLLATRDLVEHYKRHPDIAKSQEAVDTANRAAEWREKNLNPGGTPAWKSSLVRPQMIEVKPAVAWRHTLNMELGQSQVRFTDSEDSPFGVPGEDYSPEYTVTSDPLFL